MPLIWALVLLSATAYATGITRLWRRAGRVGAGLSRWRALSFVAALITIGLALASPLDAWADLLFSAHMTQHELLMLVAAPLAAAGRPGLAWLWLLPRAGRARAGHMLVALRPWWHFFTQPVVVFMLHGLTIWLAHVPSLFTAALANEVVHGLQHFLMFASALLFWWALVEGRYGRLGYGAAIMFVFGTSLHTGLLGAGFTFVPRVVYAPYAATGHAIGINPLEDQQLAGLIMWIPASVVFLLTGLGLFAAWLGASAKQADGAGHSVRPIGIVLAAAATVLSGRGPTAAELSKPTRVLIGLVGVMSDDESKGLKLSTREASTLGALVGTEITVVPVRTAGPPPGGVIAGRGTNRSGVPPHTPVVWLGVIPGSRTPCDYSVVREGSSSARERLWDGALVKFGAAQLNERYRREFDDEMSPQAWAAWFAVKAVTESLIAHQPDACRVMRERRFDGHKGIALRFDLRTGQLHQPAYIVSTNQGRRVLTEVR